ncbi:hypothetical protein ZWY2020_033050 [Hordeum vulgare]|nr:hypothetical protein ZWY2020_033050 [Hordeum vulgare]
MFVIPFMTRLGITDSWGGWSISGGTVKIRVFRVMKVWVCILWVACFGFGEFHVTVLYGPVIWVSIPYGLTRRVQAVNPTWGAQGFDPFVPRGIASHHIAADVSPTRYQWDQRYFRKKYIKKLAMI